MVKEQVCRIISEMEFQFVEIHMLKEKNSIFTTPPPKKNPTNPTIFSRCHFIKKRKEKREKSSITELQLLC